MPYIRKGKCVYNKETGEKKGCSSSIEKAKRYMKALYSSEIKEYLDNKDASSNLSDKETDLINYYYQSIVGKNHKELFKNYGPEADQVAYYSAVDRAKNKLNKMNKKELKEIIKDVLNSNKSKKDQDGDGDNDFADVMVSRMMASGKSKEDAVKATKNKKYNKESLGEGGDGRTENYMFFSNLKQMKRQIEILMEMDPTMVDSILQNGHDWADDHITAAKENVDQVFDFLMNETK
jgi:hypothetical protein